MCSEVYMYQIKKKKKKLYVITLRTNMNVKMMQKTFSDLFSHLLYY